MKETVALTVLVEITHNGKASRRAALEAAGKCLTRDYQHAVWLNGWFPERFTVGRSRAVATRATKRRIGRRRV